MAFNLRRLLLAAALLPLAFRVQEVKTTGGGKGSNENTTVTGTAGGNETAGAGAPGPANGTAVIETPEPENGTAGNDTSANVTSANGTVTTQEPPDCPGECYDSKYEVLAECDNKLIAFDNLCYYYQHKCINYESECRIYCCLYPGTDLASASKFDCRDWCKF